MSVYQIYLTKGIYPFSLFFFSNIYPTDTVVRSPSTPSSLSLRHLSDPKVRLRWTKCPPVRTFRPRFTVNLGGTKRLVSCKTVVCVCAIGVKNVRLPQLYIEGKRNGRNVLVNFLYCYFV